ncbi:MAG: hypothetical protein JXB62_00685 [Pirellulales bacterium]|nr:hypothetical protein [Pirellulales bacterium]
MRSTAFSVHPGLAESSRLPLVTSEARPSDLAAWLLLLGAGATAALATALLEMGLRIPGHAIVRAVFPMAFGLALVPRRMGGMVMAAGALGTALVIHAGAWAVIGFGAMTSLVLTGPLLDVALWRAGRGWRLYLGFVLAGLASNLAALATRAGAKFFGFDHAVGKPLAYWLPQAVGTYAICGALAGLISALVWFQFSADRRGNSASETGS